MKTYTRILAVAMAAGLVAACSGTGQISHMPVKGGAFETGLRDGYVKLADSEYDQTDFGSGAAFADRARAAAMGKPTAPEAIAARKLVAPHLAELTAARAQLADALGKGAAKNKPADAARAQVSFDCWMEQAEENIQPEDIRACRDRFAAAMKTLGVAVAKPAAKKPAKKMVTTPYVVYFDFNSARLNKAALAGLDFLKSVVKKDAKITITGFADRSGDFDYNNILATKRARAVENWLSKAGFSVSDATIYGEERPAVATKDGAREALNRRVEIAVTQ